MKYTSAPGIRAAATALSSFPPLSHSLPLSSPGPSFHWAGKMRRRLLDFLEEAKAFLVEVRSEWEKPTALCYLGLPSWSVQQMCGPLISHCRNFNLLLALS